MKARHHHDGLYKRCAHPRRTWAKCPDPWHAGFQWQGTEHRTSLHVYARDRGLKRATSKTDAEGLRDRWRQEIRAGTWPDGVPAATAPRTDLTFADICREYLKRYVNIAGRRDRAAANIGYQVAALQAAEVLGAGGVPVRLEAKPLAGITRADLEMIRETRRAQLAAAPEASARVEASRAALRAWRRTPRTRKAPKPDAPIAGDVALARFVHASKGGEVGTNRLLRRLRHVFTWAIERGYVTETPFKRNGVPMLKLNQAVERARARRLDGDEERRLLDAAGPHLRALIEAALETGCRKGELLTLQWHQVHLDQDVIALPAEKTKTADARTVPITARLKAILEMRKTGPDGKDHKPDAYVFGNEVGEPVKCIKTAWRATCRRAGIADLHFHDLRRECGSRLLETPGVALHEVRDWLGHTNVSQTSTYLATTVSKMQETRRKFDLRRTLVAQTGQTAPAPAGAASTKAADSRVN